MPGESYTLREVAELLGVSKRTLQRRMKEGAFPGRYLAPGRHGLETRIPGDDVMRALDDLRSAGPQRAGETLLPASELNDSLVPFAGPSHLVPAVDLERVRSVVAEVLREDRAEILSVVEAVLLQRAEELSAIRKQIADVLVAVERIRAHVERPGAPPAVEAFTVVPAGRPEVEAMLREIDEIERMLGALS